MDFLTNPFIAVLLFLYQVLGQSIVVTIIVFTVLTRLITFPLTRQQMQSTRRMQSLTPKLNKLKEKYKNDREKLAAEQMKLYREEGVNPLAGCLPLIIQLPILFGLYGAIRAALATNPVDLLDLNHRLAPGLAGLLPLQNRFLWLNLGQPDPTFLLPILVVASTWLQSKLMTPTPTDPKDPSAAMSRNMTLMMPLMIGLFSLSFASGLSIYWITSNVVGIAQYALMGKVNLRTAILGQPKTTITKEVVSEPARVEGSVKKKSLPAPSSKTDGKPKTAKKNPSLSKAAGKPKTSKVK